MVFRSKVDIFFITFIFLVVLIMAAISLLPNLFNYEEASLSIVIILSAIFSISVGFILWYANTITYVFNEDYLLIKGGPFKSKILYQNITKVSPTTDRFTGYRISSSEKGLELFYKSATLESIKILPKDKIEFITELRKRCPNAQFQEFE
ncbi:PH domain-containing protein [Psychrobacillus sp. FSL H8-0483]|uniref:PH domain-containing protein n=1 Tax=Psychrobacillus sp. FSL H8-0483 TaxID=2921389 RepID=UPI00315B0254